MGETNLEANDKRRRRKQAKEIRLNQKYSCVHSAASSSTNKSNNNGNSNSNNNTNKSEEQQQSKRNVFECGCGESDRESASGESERRKRERARVRWKKRAHVAHTRNESKRRAGGGFWGLATQKHQHHPLPTMHTTHNHHGYTHPISNPSICILVCYQSCR